jgi:hypothetical protein
MRGGKPMQILAIIGPFLAKQYTPATVMMLWETDRQSRTFLWWVTATLSGAHPSVPDTFQLDAILSFLAFFSVSRNQ